MLRKANLSDSKIIWEWRNDEVSRAMFFSSDKVPWENHVPWFEKSLTNPNRHMFIYELNVPIAVLRLDVENKFAKISINVNPDCRGKRHGKTAVLLCIEKAKELGIDTLIAQIKPENKPSIKLFVSVGFKEINDRFILTVS